MQKEPPHSQTKEYRLAASRKRRQRPDAREQDLASSRASFVKRRQKYLVEQESSTGLSDEAKAFIIRRMFNNAKTRAKRMGIVFEITKEDLVLPEFCPIANVPLVLGTRSRTDRANFSLDRIDNKKGYTKDNIAIISLHANVIKGNRDIAYFERMLAYMKGEK